MSIEIQSLKVIHKIPNDFLRFNFSHFTPYVTYRLILVQLVKCISLQRLRVYMQVQDPYDSYRSLNNDLRVVQFVNCISLEGLGVYIQVHDPYDSYGSENNGLRVVQFVNCISLERIGVYMQVHDPYESYGS